MLLITIFNALFLCAQHSVSNDVSETITSRSTLSRAWKSKLCPVCYDTIYRYM